MLLIKHPRFLKEYEEFQLQINKITDENIKNDLSKLLVSLVNAVSKIDSFHQDFGIRNPNNSLTQTREELTRIRKQIISRLKECQSSGLISA